MHRVAKGSISAIPRSNPKHPHKTFTPRMYERVHVSMFRPYVVRSEWVNTFEPCSSMRLRHLPYRFLIQDASSWKDVEIALRAWTRCEISTYLMLPFHTGAFEVSTEFEAVLDFHRTFSLHRRRPQERRLRFPSDAFGLQLPHPPLSLPSVFTSASSLYCHTHLKRIDYIFSNL